MADLDFVVNTGISVVGNTFVANTSGILFNAAVTFSNGTTLIANGSAPSANQVLAANSSGGLYWYTQPPAVNTLSVYSFANTVTFRGAVVLANSVSTNGSYGTAGQVLVYNGSNSYWSTAVKLISASGAVQKTNTDSTPVLSVDAFAPSPAGQYGLPAITVDQYGRISAASIAGAGGVQTMASANSAAVTVTGTSGNASVGYYGDITVNLANLYATSTTFGAGQITIDAYGRIVAAANSFSGNVAISNNYAIAPALKAYSEYVSNVTASSASTSLDLSDSNFFVVTLASNTTLSFTNQPSGRAFSFNVVAKQDNTGGRVLTLPSSCKYPNGQKPTSTTVAQSVDLWSFTTYDAGSTYVASLSVRDAR